MSSFRRGDINSNTNNNLLENCVWETSNTEYYPCLECCPLKRSYVYVLNIQNIKNIQFYTKILSVSWRPYWNMSKCQHVNMSKLYSFLYSFWAWSFQRPRPQGQKAFVFLTHLNNPVADQLQIFCGMCCWCKNNDPSIKSGANIVHFA